MAKKRNHISNSQVDGDVENSESDEVSSEESENRRGRTVVAEVGKAIQKGIKIPLEWNHNKVPTGVNRKTFANYIGVVVRERVSINFRDWDEVLEKVKDEVYEHITEISDLNRERVKKRTSTYRGGRKGYLYYEEEIIKELIRKKIPVGEVPRHIVWIRAHSREENGVIYFDNPTDFELGVAIKELEAQQIKGEIDGTGRNDVLGRAFKTPEHGGCVRGVGSGVTNKQYFGFNKPIPSNQVQLELCSVKSELENVKNNQKLVISYFTSGEFNPQNTKQLIDSLKVSQDGCYDGRKGLNDFVSSSGQSTHTHTLFDSGIQGVQFQLKDHFASIQEGNSGGIKRNKNGTGSGGNKRKTDHLSGNEKETHVEPRPSTSPVKGTSYVPDFVPQNDDVIVDHLFPKGVESMCSLAIEKDDWVDIVAHGCVYVPNDGEVVKHNFKPVPADHYRVTITEEVNSNAPLPCPEGEIRYICQGKGYILTWHVHLVILINKAKVKPTNEIQFQGDHFSGTQDGASGGIKRKKSQACSSGIKLNKDHLSGNEEETHVEPRPRTSPVKDTTYVPNFVPENEDVIVDHLFPKGVESMCSLGIKKDDWVDIVAHGCVYVPKDGEVVKHHFKPVPADHYRVTITKEVNSNASLPCP